MVKASWRELFSDQAKERPIEIEADHAVYGRLALTITSEQQPMAEIPLGANDGDGGTNLFEEPSLTFRFTGPYQAQVKSHIRMKGQGFEVNPPTTDVPFQAVILLSWNRSAEEDAVRLGRLRQKKKGEGLLLRALQNLDPRLQSIEDNSSSGAPMIWGDIGWSELAPLPVMGEGMTQMARVVLAIASAQDGVVMVDEIENGIHHSVLPDIWRAIHEAATQFRTQVFATTHSLECVEAAHESIGTDGLRLHRLEIRDEESCCVTYEPDSIVAAIKHGLEVR